MTFRSTYSSVRQRLRMATRQKSNHGRLIAIVYFALSIATIYPIFTVNLPPLVDYPNHIARVHILASISETASLKDNYVPAWGVVPNLAMDILLVPVAKLVPALDAGRIFIAATLMLLIGGTLALHRAVHGMIGLWPSAIYLFLYNYLLLWGFLNYLFTIGLFLCAFAGWIASERWPPARRLVLFSAVTLILFFGHLFAFAVYCLSVSAYELWRLRESHRPLLSRAGLLSSSIRFIQFVPPLALWLAFPVGNEFSLTYFGTLRHKALALLSPTLFSLDSIDLAIFAFACVVLFYGLFTKTIKLAPQIQFPLIVLGAVAILMPNWLFAVWGADFRLPTVLVFLAIAGIRIQCWKPKTAGIVAVVALVMFGARIWTITDSWGRFDQQVAEFQEIARTIEEGARVLTVELPPPGLTDKARGALDPIAWLLKAHSVANSRGPDGRRLFYPSYWHLPSLAVIERSVFLPTMFTGPQQPLRAAAANKAIDTPSGHPISLRDLRIGADLSQASRLAKLTDRRGRAIYWAAWPKNFDYVLVLHFDTPPGPLPGPLMLVQAGSFFTLYAVVNPPDNSTPGVQ